ncbi:MAG: DUF6599 family protein [Terriglobales bacterium]
MTVGKALLILVVATAIACTRTSMPADPFPSEAGGWRKAGATRTFEAANLAQYIDGDAERFVKAGVEKTLTADYRHRDGTEAVADVFVMAKAQGAKEILEDEPVTGSHALAIGDSGRSNGETVTFRQGRYFVRVTGFQKTTAVSDLAKAVAAALNEKNY